MKSFSIAVVSKNISEKTGKDILDTSKYTSFSLHELSLYITLLIECHELTHCIVEA